MPDIVDSVTRSRMMAGIRSKNTKPEMMVRQAIYAAGFRYRLHNKKLPGKPDLTFPRYRAAMFVNGCFWHGHDCALFRIPETRREFWETKIARNRQRDILVRQQLTNDGWRVLTVWECSIRGRASQGTQAVIDSVTEWLLKGSASQELRGI